MKAVVLLPIVCAALFCSINGGIIDEKEIFETFSTDLQRLKALVAERKAEYDRNTHNVSVFKGIKHFRTSGGYSQLFRTMTNFTLGDVISNYTSYALNDDDFEQEIVVTDQEPTVLSVKNVTRGISPDLIYESWNIGKDTFSKSSSNVTIVLEKQHCTSYSVTNETDVSQVLTMRRPYKVKVPAHSKVRVTTTIHSGVKSMLFALELNLGIKSDDFETETSFSDDEVKSAAFEFFFSEYWNTKNSTEDYNHINIIKTYNDGIALSGFPFIVTRTHFNFKRDVGEAEPL